MSAASVAGKVSWKAGAGAVEGQQHICQEGWTEESWEEGRSLGLRVSTDWDTHLGRERTQIEQMEVTGQWRSQRVERMQRGAGALPLGHR